MLRSTHMPTIEELDSALSHPSVTCLGSHELCQGDHFKRCRTFTVANTKYKIVWWANAMEVHIGDAFVYCDGLSVSGTWPNRSKLNLQFTTGGEVSLVIALEPYDSPVESPPDIP